MRCYRCADPEYVAADGTCTYLRACLDYCSDLMVLDPALPGALRGGSGMSELEVQDRPSEALTTNGHGDDELTSEQAAAILGYDASNLTLLYQAGKLTRRAVNWGANGKRVKYLYPRAAVLAVKREREANPPSGGRSKLRAVPVQPEAAPAAPVVALVPAPAVAAALQPSEALAAFTKAGGAYFRLVAKWQAAVAREQELRADTLAARAVMDVAREELDRAMAGLARATP